MCLIVVVLAQQLSSCAPHGRSSCTWGLVTVDSQASHLDQKPSGEGLPAFASPLRGFDACSGRVLYKLATHESLGGKYNPI
jgi:hypothetical protein